MVERSTVVWAPDPFRPGTNPRPWLVLAAETLPYPGEECIAAACTTRSHHAGSVALPNEAWRWGAPEQTSHVLPWTLATLKTDVHVVGRQGAVDAAVTEDVAAAASAFLEE